MNNQVKNATIFQALEKWAPTSLAYDWDPVGLQVGSSQRIAQKVMITLDVSESVVDEAVQKDVDLIIAHHPLLFKPLQQINLETPIGRTLYKLIQEDITVYAAHTNLDIASGGVNDMLCEQLNLRPTDYVAHRKAEKLYKLAVYVPKANANQVREAMSNAGAGFIGDYSHCSFQTEGEGTFKPGQGTDPHIGEPDQLTFVEEFKIETIIEESIMDEVKQAMIHAHPYEEVAFDIYPLVNEGKSFGLGRIGILDQEMTLEQFTEEVKVAFRLDHVRVVGSLKQNIEKIAIIGGSGEKFIQQARQKGADVLITGDMTFHPSQEAEAIGLSVIDAGHYIEEVMKKATKNKLKQLFTKENIEWITSEINTNPFQWM